MKPLQDTYSFPSWSYWCYVSWSGYLLKMPRKGQQSMVNFVSLSLLETKALVTAENVTEYSSDLVEATSDSGAISGEGLEAVAAALQKIVEVGDPSEEVSSLWWLWIVDVGIAIIAWCDAIFVFLRLWHGVPNIQRSSINICILCNFWRLILAEQWNDPFAQIC